MKLVFVETEINEEVKVMEMDKELDKVLDVVTYIDKIKVDNVVYKVDHEDILYDFDKNELDVTVEFLLEI